MKPKPKRKIVSKLTDAERHARFVQTAHKVEASEDPKDFEKAFKRIVPVRKSFQSAKKG